jgi:hypothetical protein
MANVDQIACVNGGGFVMKFRVIWSGGNSGWSGEFSNPNSESIDLNLYNIAPGTALGIEVDPFLSVHDKTWGPSTTVEFQPNCDATQTFKATGGVDHVNISPIGTPSATGVAG